MDLFPSTEGLLGLSGAGLNVAERAGLELSMQAITQEEKLARGSLSFWGKISGDSNDYLIAVATQAANYPFPSRKFYYTTSTKPEKLSIMPEKLSEAYVEHAKTLLSRPMSGEPSFPYEILAKPLAEGEEAVEPLLDENGEEIPPEIFREEHRLAFVVSLIDHDVAIVPRGAYMVDAAHQVVKSKVYEGLSFEAAGQLRNYYHFRAPESEHCTKALEKPGVVRPGDFLDPLEADLPKGCFSLVYSTSKTVAVLRSFYWPGSFFYHVIASSEYGSVYFGDGMPNLDIQFML